MQIGGHGDPRRTRLRRGIIGLLAVLVIIGVVSSGAYLYLRLTGSSQGVLAVDQLGTEEVEPRLALGTLAGASDLEVVNRALAEGELETGYAGTLFNTQFSDRESIGNLLLIGARRAVAGDTARARSCYEQASLMSTLSPTLSDFDRASSFVGIGGRFAELGDRETAVSNLDQAFALAVHSPIMRDPLRADLLDQVAEEFESLDLREKAEGSRALGAEIRYGTAEDESPGQGDSEQSVANFLTGIAAPSAAMVTSYEERRAEAVRELMDFLQGSSGRDAVPQDLATGVTQALVNEDEARSTSYEDELASASSLVLRIGTAQARVDWLLLKYRVALGAYGLELVPAWSDDVATVAAELNAARRELHTIYGEEIATFGDQTAEDRAWFDVLRWEILQGRLGLYPGYPEQELVSQLMEVTGRLTEAGVTSLFPEVVYEDGTPRFSLAWAGSD